MQQHTLNFDGEGVTAERCIIFKMVVDHGRGCAFCGRELKLGHADATDGWNVFQCAEITKDSNDYVEEQTALVYICEHCCNHSKAYQLFDSNGENPLLQNKSNEGLYRIEASFSG
jgi:hypothetical protein